MAKRKRRLYLIGSLRNPQIPVVAQSLRQCGYEVFDDWHSAGPNADDHLRDYEKARGHSYAQGLKGHAARHVYNFDKHHIDASDIGVMLLPAGKSGHLELGYMIGQGKPGFIWIPESEPERWDIMYQFADAVVYNELELVIAIEETKR